MTYVDGFVLPVSRKNLKAYRVMAQQGARIWMKHGALDYKECVGDDMHPKWVKTVFPKLAKVKAGETVVFSYIVYKSKAHRNAVNARVMKDPFMTAPDNQNKKMPFDMKRMAYGGFKTLVEA